LQDAIDEVFDARIGDVSGRGKLAADMREIWMMQPRFEKRVGSTPFGLVEQPRFRAGFDFLRLRADIEEVDIRLADWWQEFSMASDSEREDLVQAAKAEQQALQTPKPRVRRAPRPDGAVAAPKATAAAAPEAETDDAGAPKKRRRRRRPAGAGGAGGESGSAE
jgi:poly(A) polymerase